jgi:RNA polymerase sigma-70 factor (ECF subfamily)
MNDELINKLFKDNMKIIYKYLLKIGCSHHDAEDIIQDTMCKFIEYTNVIDIDKASSWLFKVALNKYYDLCRRRSKYPSINIDDKNFILSIFNEVNTQCNDQIDIKSILSRLNPTYRNLLILKYDIGLSYKDISKVLDMSEDKIRTYLYRARRSFKVEYGGKCSGG